MAFGQVYGPARPRGKRARRRDEDGLEDEAPPDRTAEAVEQATLLLAEGLTRREVVRRLSETLGLPRNDAYRLVMELP